ncbi:unnamed protein product [Orchesella dallaii]|uniref:Uncharacterized protein n=1 Tax=Orchesella dallaii TaxID=48710 RepID=A0ABP1R8D5_9HEXA
MDFESTAYQNNPIPNVKTIFRSSNEIERCVSQMSIPEGNPFPSRRVAFVATPNWDNFQGTDDTLDIETRFWRTWIRLAEMFGKYIEHVHFCYVFNKTFHSGTAQGLCNYLRQVPNLKSLSMSGEIHDWYRYVTNPFSQHRLPRPRNLGIKATTICHSRSIITYCCNQETLSEVSVTFQHTTGLPSTVYSFTKMKFLGGVATAADLDMLSSLENPPPLSSFQRAQVTYDGHLHTVDSQYFLALQAFSPTLPSVEISHRFAALRLQEIMYFPNLTS